MRVASHIDFCGCVTLTPVSAKCNFTSRHQAKSSLAVYSRPVDCALPQLLRQQDLWLERNNLAATQLPTWHPHQARASAVPAREEGRFCVNPGKPGILAICSTEVCMCESSFRPLAVRGTLTLCGWAFWNMCRCYHKKRKTLIILAHMFIFSPN